VRQQPADVASSDTLNDVFNAIEFCTRTW